MGKFIREKEKAVNFAVAAVLIFLLIGMWMWTKRPFSGPDPEKELVITAFSVGKADAMLIRNQDTVIVVDTGEEEDGAYLTAELKARGVERIDLLVVTHFDKDHVGGAAALAEAFPIESVRMPDYEGDRPEYEAFLECIEEHRDVKRLASPENLILGEISLTLYPAEDPEEILSQKGEYDNDMSLVMSMTFEERRFLFTGDIEKIRIAQMLASDVDWSHDWIKMPHHGRYKKNLEELLEAVKPAQALICCSEDEPAEEKTLKLLEEKDIPVWDTSKGNVVVTCRDGQITSALE